MNNNIDVGEYKRMSPEDVEGLMHMRRRAFTLKNKKGKGSYNRDALKSKSRKEIEDAVD